MLSLSALRSARTLMPYCQHVLKATVLCSSTQQGLFNYVWLKKCQINSRPQSSVSYVAKKGLLQSLKSKLENFVTVKSRIKIGGVLAFEEIGDSINHEQFMKFFQLPDAFQSWFLSVQLHVWMCIVITINERNGRIFRNILVDAMWHDVELRMEKLTDLKSSQRKKYLDELNAQFRAVLISLDEGILSDDKTLAASVWRLFFSSHNIDPELLENFVAYIRIQLAHLDGQNLEQIMQKGKISYKPLSSIFPSAEN